MRRGFTRWRDLRQQIAVLNAENADEQPLLIETAGARIAAREVEASQAEAMSHAGRRAECERRMLARGMDEASVIASRGLPLDRLEAAVMGDSPMRADGCFTHATAGPPIRCHSERSSPIPTATAERSERSESVKAQQCGGERKPVIDADQRRLEERMWAWLAPEPEQSRNPLRSGWLKRARENPRAMYEALNALESRSGKLNPVRRRWSILLNRWQWMCNGGDQR